MHSYFSTFAGFNTESMVLWGKKSDPIIHAYNLFISVFSMLGPLVARPFLGDARTNLNHTMSQNMSVEMNLSSVENISTAQEVVNVTEPNDISLNRTLYPCLIVSLPLLGLAFLRFILFIPERKQIFAKKIQPAKLPIVVEKEHISKVRQVVLSMLFVCAGIPGDALQIIWTGFGPGYATKYHSWTMKNAAMIPFTFWIITMIARLISIPVARLVEAPRILTACNVFLLAISAVLVILGESQTITLLICCGITAVFTAPLNAAGVSWTCNTLGVSGLNSSLSMAGNGLGCMFAAVLAARMCEAYGARMFSWTGLGINAIMFFSIISICMMKRMWKPADTQRQANFESELNALASGNENT